MTCHQYLAGVRMRSKGILVSLVFDQENLETLQHYAYARRLNHGIYQGPVSGDGFCCVSWRDVKLWAEISVAAFEVVYVLQQELPSIPLHKGCHSGNYQGDDFERRFHFESGHRNRQNH